MKFDYIVGNPPYQEERENTKDKPIYNNFMDGTYKIGDKVLLITPARFLFNVGSTPKEWNEKILNDKHFKVLKYEPNCKKVFSGVDIKGGVAIHYRDSKENFGEIGVFTAFDELNSIMKKVNTKDSLVDIIYSASSYRFTDLMHKDYPNVEGMMSKGNKYEFQTNVFDVFSNIIFFDKKNTNTMIAIQGRKANNRRMMYIERNYVEVPNNFEKYKVFLPNSNGSGTLGEVLSTPLVGEPLVGEPLVGHTKTFLSIGCFDKKVYAENCMKYVKSKFARCMLGILKNTQHNSKYTWRYVPIQDFTENSDIDWSVSVSEIDKQLYKKYGLDEKEIAFIEEKVKEME